VTGSDPTGEGAQAIDQRRALVGPDGSARVEVAVVAPAEVTA
jgi:hypothetical protein